MSDPRIPVRKTYKLYIGGAFPRSESGRSYVVSGADGGFPRQRRPGLAKGRPRRGRGRPQGLCGLVGATAYNRGQVLYRVAEMLDGRRSQFVDEIGQGEATSREEAAAAVDAAVDRWVWYAGWADKVAQVAGSSNPVAGPYFNFSVPEPTGVVGVLAPQRSSLLGLVSVLAPVLLTGNTVVLLASEQRPLPAITLAEVLDTSDVPGGVVNLLTGRVAELAPVLAAHRDVDALDLAGAPGELVADLERAAVTNVKRVLHPPSVEPDWSAAPTTRRMLAFLETKTVWHPVGV